MLMNDIDMLHQWKKDIENELVNNVPDGVRTALIIWSSKIQQEIDKRNSMYTSLRRWDSTFLDNLLIAQVQLLVKIEKHERCLEKCVKRLKRLNHPSRTKFQKGIQKSRRELDTWKSNCITVLQSFEDNCIRLVQSWQNETEGSQLLVQFLSNIKLVFSTKVNTHSLIFHFCSKYYDELEGLFKTYEEKANKCDSRLDMQQLKIQLCRDLAHVSSFKNIQFTDFIDKIKNNASPKLTKTLESKLNGISRPADLNNADNSLLVILFRKSNLIHFKFQKFDEDPPDCDTSINSDCLHLKLYRNRIVAHTAQGKIHSDSFDNLWENAKEVICRIASRCGHDLQMRISIEIDHMKTSPLETGREVRLRQKIVEWCKNDILTELSARTPARSHCLKMLMSMQKAQAKFVGSINAQRVYVCSSCDVEFPHEHNFSEHTCIQAPRGYICGTCKATFLTEVNCSNHKCNQAPNNYMCRKCNYISTGKYFKNHTCTIDTDPGRLKCKECWNEWSDADGFQTHKCIQAPKGYECDKCKTQISTEMEFENHRCPQVNMRNADIPVEHPVFHRGIPPQLPIVGGTLGATTAACIGATLGAPLGPVGVAIGGACGVVFGAISGLLLRR
ncbi:hypothetical protein CHS0354_000055 [Potamilus streckersoni]|uniref:DZIP3-like HEPN domain-containing protein n=1 Tax=Potamilus streckersoni TaxID=2493646 RepID=A0AAE0W126_9BIVA|nr:hypothetical protein CHS0354_000055 [Potamilus streckersoni]